MKRILLFLFILLSLYQAKASDTLTIRQVYNFNVGDSFSYHSIGNTNYITFLGNYTITDKIISANNDTIWYVRSDHGAIIDTMIIANLDSSIISVTDSPYGFSHCQKTLTSDSACNTIRNTINVGCGLAANSLAYIEGLGNVDNNVGYDDNTYQDVYLIYYTKAGVTDTTPYISLRVSNIKTQSAIDLYPNPTTDQLHLSFSDAGAYNIAQFIITDILGQEVYSSTVTQNETIHDISKLSAGIYTWRVVTENDIIKTGKVVKE